MARYDREFVGIPAVFAEATGMDPNYADGYSGMRMRGGNGKAAYGAYRRIARDSLETAGGVSGIHRTAGLRGRVNRRTVPASWEDSGRVSDPFRDAELIREYNASSPMLEPEVMPERSRGTRESQQTLTPRRWEIREGFEQGYTDRGMPQAGFSESWARGPMPGAR